MKIQRTEFKIGLLLSALGLLLGRFLTNPAGSFFSGTFIALGILLLIINMLPEKTYKNLAYKKVFIRKDDDR